MDARRRWVDLCLPVSYNNPYQNPISISRRPQNCMIIKDSGIHPVSYLMLLRLRLYRIGAGKGTQYLAYRRQHPLRTAVLPYCRCHMAGCACRRHMIVMVNPLIQSIQSEYASCSGAVDRESEEAVKHAALFIGSFYWQ